MSKARPDALAEWRAVVPLVHGMVEGRNEIEIDRRPDADR
jgi:hypothetical protein